MLDEKSQAALIRHPVCRIQHRSNGRYRGSTAVTAQARSCRYRDPSLQCPEGILLHRCICQENKGSPPDGVCQAREFHTDNLPLRPLSVQPLSAAQPREEATPLSSLLAANSWTELVRLD